MNNDRLVFMRLPIYAFLPWSRDTVNSIMVRLCLLTGDLYSNSSVGSDILFLYNILNTVFQDNRVSQARSLLLLFLGLMDVSFLNFCLSLCGIIVKTFWLLLLLEVLKWCGLRYFIKFFICNSVFLVCGGSAGPHSLGVSFNHWSMKTKKSW